MGRRSETGREQRVTPEFGDYQRRKKFYPQIQGVTLVMIEVVMVIKVRESPP
jgi:hypothetical protein